MIHEHALTYENKLSIEQLDYLAKKANKLGGLGRQLISVHEEKDVEGTHVYFDLIQEKNAHAARAI